MPILGRNKEENKLLLGLKSHDDYIFEVPGYGSPITILEGTKSKEAIELAAKLTARYSDAGASAEEKGLLVEYKYKDKEQKEVQVTSIVVSPLAENEVARLRI